MSQDINKLIEEEKQILNEIKKEEKTLKNIESKMWVLIALFALLIVSSITSIAYWQISSKRIYTDKADIEAPNISLSPSATGVLQEVYVNVGDQINSNTIVAKVGNELIKSKSSGIVTKVDESIGKTINAGSEVVTVIDPNELRVVAHIDEDKGLSDISIGDQVNFTVDAFGGKTYQGIVDEISPTSRQNDIVFSISDKRETKVFDIKIRFDNETYKELRNGMSAKVWIYKN